MVQGGRVRGDHELDLGFGFRWGLSLDEATHCVTLHK